MKSNEPRCPASNSRDSRLDALRGWGVALVVLGHALVAGLELVDPTSSGAVFLLGVGYARPSIAIATGLNAIYSMHMPLLAFISGFVLADSRRGYGLEFVRRRCWGLFVPYVAWLVVNWGVSGNHTPVGFLRYVTAGLVDPHSAGALWFLYALFVSTLILAWMMRVGGSTRLLAISAVLVGAAGIVPLGQYERAFGISDVAWLYPFLIGGVLVARYRHEIDGLRWALPASAVVWLVTLPLVWQVLVPGERWWYGAITPIFAPLGGTMTKIALKSLWAGIRVVGAFGGVLATYLVFARLTGYVADWLAWLGRRTLGIYATHGHFLLIPLAGLAAMPRHLAYFGIALAGSIIVTLLLERNSVTRKVLLGISEPL